jgi:hypothetical protein
MTWVFLLIFTHIYSFLRDVSWFAGVDSCLSIFRVNFAQFYSFWLTGYAVSWVFTRICSTCPFGAHRLYPITAFCHGEDVMRDD